MNQAVSKTINTKFFNELATYVGEQKCAEWYDVLYNYHLESLEVGDIIHLIANCDVWVEAFSNTELGNTDFWLSENLPQIFDLVADVCCKQLELLKNFRPKFQFSESLHNVISVDYRGNEQGFSNVVQYGDGLIRQLKSQEIRKTIGYVAREVWRMYQRVMASNFHIQHRGEKISDIYATLSPEDAPMEALYYLNGLLYAEIDCASIEMIRNQLLEREANSANLRTQGFSARAWIYLHKGGDLPILI